MKSKMHKTLKLLYPDDFSKKAKRIKRPGIIKRQFIRVEMFFAQFERRKLVLTGLTLMLLLTGLYTVYIYNNFTSLLNDIHTASSNIEKEVQRRNDLINNLIPPTLKYLNYEKDLFSHVVQIRKEALTQQKGLEKSLSALKSPEGGNLPIGNVLAPSLPSLLGIFENYPDLKASKPFLDIMQELIATENRIADSRNNFNLKVNIYNTYITRLPASMFAKSLGYKVQTWFSAESAASNVPDMKKINIFKSDILNK